MVDIDSLAWRDALELAREHHGCVPRRCPEFAAHEKAFTAALSQDAGRALLERVAKLEAVADIANDCAQGLEMGVSPGGIAKYLRDVLAALDALEGGRP